MPEIPDLEAIRGFLNERLPGQTVESVEVKIPHVVRTGATILAESLPGDAFGETQRHGKFLLFSLASGRVLAINPMLTGRFQYAPPDAKKQGRTCLRLSLSGGNELRYADLRVMGRIYLLPLEELEAIPNWTAGGPDLLDPALTEEVWLEHIRKYRGRIKNILTKAEFVQGVGNAYSDEILWEAGFHPHRRGATLDDDGRRELYRAMRRVFERSQPILDARVAEGLKQRKEEWREHLQVHRRTGEACPRCEREIRGRVSGGRETNFCIACQPLDLERRPVGTARRKQA